MMTLLEIRDRIISVYKQYRGIFSRLLRFAAVLLGLVYITGKIDYNQTLGSPLLLVILSLLATLLPDGAVIFLYALVIILQLYSLCLEAAVVSAILFLLMFLLYFRFSPGDGILFVLAPAAEMVGIPYVLPIAGGLLFGPLSGITSALGMITVMFIRFVSENEAAISQVSGESDMVTRFRLLIDGIVQNEELIVTAVAFAAAGALVYVIRRLEIRYSWYIAVGCGAVAQLLVILIGDMLFSTNTPIAALFLGVLFSSAIGAVITFFAFNLDYSRIEKTQFEDDEYYYYVRAIPKNVFVAPRRTVKRINTSRRVDEAAEDAQETEEGYEDPYPAEGDDGGGYYDDDQQQY